MLVALVGLGWAAACSGNLYTPPASGPTATIIVASSCLTSQASYYARINGQRTESYGCNQTATWEIAPGPTELIVQVEEARFRVDPLQISFEIAEGQCASFLLRQRQGYDLEVFGISPCDE